MKLLRNLILIGLGLFLLLSCFYTVDNTEYVYVTRLGRHVATYDGGKDEEAGLHFGLPWPFETTIRAPRRLMYFQLPAAELVTEDKTVTGTVDKTVTIDGFVVWRIPNAEALDRYVRSVGTPEQAERILLDYIGHDLGTKISGLNLDELFTADEDEVRMVKAKWDELREELMAPHRSEEGERSTLKHGIEVVDLQIRRINYPPQVRGDIFQRIISERQKKVAYYTSEGRKEAERIRSDSDATIKKLKAEVAAELAEKRGMAEAKADRIRNEAQRLDPEYYAELKKRQIALDALGEKTKVWSTTLWDLLFPTPEKEGEKGRRGEREMKTGGDFHP